MNWISASNTKMRVALTKRCFKIISVALITIKCLLWWHNTLDGGYITNEGLDDGGDDSDDPSAIDKIMESIQAANSEQLVRNKDTFGVVNSEPTAVVIVVQVHNRLEYLRELIGSMERAKHIEKALIVFSHDVWDDDINKLVESIDFARTLQMFYPFSIQTHPDSFPGQSRDDCPRNLDQKMAEDLQCNNAKWPDMYHHYREAKFAQTKHHWWWKANRIFSGLKVTRNYDGLFLFLEEDHYVTEDFLHVLLLMDHENTAENKTSDVLCLGTYENIDPIKDQLVLDWWMSSKHNMGMAFSRKTWLKIHSCRETFCTYDDYNWDWSLNHVSLSCFKQPMQVMLMSMPRVFHLGYCGMHQETSDCKLDRVRKLKNELWKMKSLFYPSQIAFKQMEKTTPDVVPNGGWGDIRDHNLCLEMSLNPAPTLLE